MTRVSSSVDTARLAEALSRAGIDPRTWTSLAIVTAVAFDAEHGYLADVILLGGQAAGLPAPARVGAAYAGPGFGLYLPLEVDDEVLVGTPSGDPAAGLVVLARMHDAGTPPPAEIADHQADLFLLAKEDATVRIAVQGGGDVILDARGTGKVRLGSEDAAHPAVQGDTLNSNVASPISVAALALFAAASALIAACTGPTFAPAGAVLTFATAMQTYLSAVRSALGSVPDTFSPNVTVK